MKYIVYKHITPCGKVYIGQTKGTMAKRAGSGGIFYKQCPYFYHAIKKYGWDNIEHIIVSDNLSKKEADYLEKYMISYYNTTDSRYGYNLTKGGDGVEGRTVSEETRAKIKNAQKGRHYSVATEYKKGHTFNEETLAKMSKARKGNTYNMRKIEAYKGDEKIGTYKSITEAAEALNINKCTISRFLNGQTGDKTKYKFYDITA